MQEFLKNSFGKQAAFDADLIDGLQDGPLDIGGFLGIWRNADAATLGLAKVVCSVVEGHLNLRAFGAGSDGDVDWGIARDVVLYAASATSHEGSGVSCRIEFPFLLTRFQANVKGGVMVAVTYNTFTDDSGRRPYFMREFLALEDAT